MDDIVFLLTGLYVTIRGSRVNEYEGLKTDVLKLYTISLSWPSTSDWLMRSQ